MKKLVLFTILSLLVFTISAQTVSVGNITGACSGVCTGTAEILVNGWTASSPTFTYEVLGSNTSDSIVSTSTTTTFNNLCDDYYLVNVYESGSLIDTSSFIIDSTSNFLNVIGNVQNIDCNNPIGEIEAIVAGGIAPYTFNWSNGQISQTITNVPFGSYFVQVTDANGCNGFGQYFLDDFANNPNPTLNISPVACGGNSGNITISYDTLTFDSTYHKWSFNDTVSLNMDSSYIDATTSGVYGVSFYGISGSTEYCYNLDSIVVPDSCGLIQGITFNDINNNGVQDASDPIETGIIIELSDGQTTVSNSSGAYYFAVGYGTYTVEAVAPTNYFFCGGYFSDTSIISAPSTGSYSVVISIGSEVSSNNDFGIHTGVPPCGEISGFVFDDINNNGIQEVGEVGKPGIAIIISGIGIVYTDGNGFYSSDAPIDDTYTVSMVVNGSSYYCNGSSISPIQSFPVSPATYAVSLTSGSPNSGNNDFGSYTPSYFDVGVYSVWSSYCTYAGGCFNTGMDFKTFGTISDTCILRLEFDPLVTFSSAGITPTVVGSNFVEWHFTSATVPGSFYCMPMSFCLDSSASAGYPLVWTASYTCNGSGGGCAFNDTIVRTWNVNQGPVKSLNELQTMDVYSINDIIGNTITTDYPVLSYMINYQNYLVDTAFHLVIMDTLPDELEVSSVTSPFGSNMNAKFTVIEPNILMWDMGEISLNDTTSAFNGSYGFVQYNATMKPGLTLGTEIENQADLYFNHGAKVSTNKSILIVDEESAITESLNEVPVLIYPNPTSTVLFIEVQSDASSSVEIMDALGAVIETQNFDHQKAVSVSHYNNGIYFIKITNNGKTTVRRFIKN